MRTQKRKVQNIGKGKISMTESRSLKEEDKFKELGNKICKFVDYYGKEGGQKILSIAALTDVLFSIKGIFKMYDERIKELEKFVNATEKLVELKENRL